MDMSFIWQSFLLILAGILLLRLAGRKSISQMTLAQTIVMISIGTIIVQPIVEKSVMKAVIGAAIFVASIIIIEFLEVKFNSFDTQNLKKLRLTVDQLEMRMRNHGISKIEDIKIATIEPNGLLGYELNDNAKPLTVGEFKKLLDLYLPLIQGAKDAKQIPPQEKGNIFEEIKERKPQDHPDFLM